MIPSVASPEGDRRKMLNPKMGGWVGGCGWVGWVGGWGWGGLGGWGGWESDSASAFEAIGRICSGTLGVLDTELVSTQPLVSLCDMIRTELRKASRTDGSKMPLPPGFDGIEPLVSENEIPFSDPTQSVKVLNGILDELLPNASPTLCDLLMKTRPLSLLRCEGGGGVGGLGVGWVWGGWEWCWWVLEVCGWVGV